MGQQRNLLPLSYGDYPMKKMSTNRLYRPCSSLCFLRVVVLFSTCKSVGFSTPFYAISAWGCIEKYELIIWSVLRKTALYQALAVFVEKYEDMESGV